MSHTTTTNQPRPLPKRRILVVNCYFDDTRRPVRRPNKVPQAMGPVYLAGAFRRETCEVRLYSELASGPLEDEALLGWPDMLVLTGLTNGFDRMLHLTAYARTKNPRVVVVAGGPPVRQLPQLAAQFFDYCCTGDIEQLRDVARDVLGREYVADEIEPRFDLAYWLSWLGHVESTRYCNFRCAFCALTGEGHSYQTYELTNLRRQLVALGRKRHLLFIDNNFYGSDRRHFEARLALINELRAAGHVRNWGAILTNDFFYHDENLTRVRAAGCELLFSGVESFDAGWLRNFNKLQNVAHPTVEMISRCLAHGIVFCYGLILDPGTRRLADLNSELEHIIATPAITLPSFLTMPIPLLGTPYFFETLKQRALFPLTKLRDMDGLTIMSEPLDPLPSVVEFLRGLTRMRGRRGRIIRHALEFARRYRRTLTPTQLALALSNAALLCAPTQTSAVTCANLRARRRAAARTYISTTEPLDDQYTPKFRLARCYERYFQPTLVTDERGELTNELAASGLLKADVQTQVVCVT